MIKSRGSLGPILGYHGCDASVAEDVLAGRIHLQPSKNDYDWLGNGIYFWVESPERAWDWASNPKGKSAARIKNPAVVGALIYPGRCLNLTDFGVLDEVRDAYNVMVDLRTDAQEEIPVNDCESAGVFLVRRLDCAVIQTVHFLREEYGSPAYDSVYGVFEEGKALYPGAGFKAKTHVQIAVRETACIAGYFRVP
ncbi:hypothetical protein DOP62_14320 (plasmid) [Synechococcus elongatus PCC 11801]|uniref:Uncharacterized protein n=1 Tax=Synechococcus elongatus PCC 11801 TaxID=2219813 RepID=A0ACD5A325_SYNEL